MITFAYMTNRREPCFQWFADSLHNELQGDYTNTKLVVVDFYADYPGRRDAFNAITHTTLTHIPPKPTVWQGQYRLATQDYFAAANARNTALCVAPNGYIVYIDDLSVLLPGWLTEVRNAAQRGYIACGTYEKVLGLTVDAGVVTGFRDYPAGHDTRVLRLFTNEPTKCVGSWLYGASFGAPVEALLSINGQDEDCDGMGFEDVICGIMLEKSGYEIRFCPRMKTLESEERHHVEAPFKRIIKPGSPDASHQMLRMALGGRNKAPNYANMRQLRQKVLFENQPFPVDQIPEHHWPDKQPIREM